MIKLRYVDSKNIYGTMNTGTISLSNITDNDKKMIMERNNLNGLEDYKFTKEDKKNIFDAHWKRFAYDKGFDADKKFMADQKDKKGTFKEITNDYVEANPGGWSDIDEDILVLTDKVPGVVIGHPVADCPVVAMHDKKQNIVALAHCSADLIDKKMPMMVADTLTQSYGTNEENIDIFVGAHAGNNWTYDSYPKWAEDEKFWENCIIFENGLYKINLKKALLKQFADRKLGKCNAIMCNVDTISDSRYYSNAAQRNDPSKYGRHFEGVFFEDNLRRFNVKELKLESSKVKVR